MKLARTVLPVCLLAALSGALLAHPVAASGASARFCAGSVATIVGTPGRDVIHGTRHRDVIVALGGDDVIHGGGGDDYLATLGTAPYPVLERGRAGDDELVSGRGDDLLDGGPGQDRASAGAGDNICVSIEAAVGSDPGCDLS